jgi:23S rRNA pseudouridine955/2504/2580 synthase
MTRHVPQSTKVRHVTIDESHVGQRLDNYLLSILKGVPRTYVYRVIRKGEVRVNSCRANPATRLQAGDMVRVPPVRTARRGALPRGLSSRWQERLSRPLYEDEELLVVDKPSGLPVHAGSGVPAGLIEILRDLNPEYRFLELAHRLDRGTSGCLIIAKKRNILKELNKLFKVNSYTNSVLNKRYLVLVQGVWSRPTDVKQPLLKVTPESGERVVVVDPDGKYAHSQFTPREAFVDATLISVKLFTGRTHQVRVHAQFEGHPVAGDEKYGNEAFNERMQDLGLRRLFLHANKIAFKHPGSGEKLEIVSALPQELSSVLEQF